MVRKLIDLTQVYIHETDKALLVQSDFGNEVWLPKSVVEFDTAKTYKRGDPVEITLPEDYAQEKELI